MNAKHQLEVALNWMGSRQTPKTFYSMTQRLGQVVNGREGYDCSSSVYFALRAAGIFPAIMGNTTTMLSHLPAYGWKEIPAKADGTIDAQRGDIFLWDVDGTGWSNAGGGKHTGIFTDANNIIHCNYSYNGISINNHDAYYTAAGVKQLRVFRYYGAPQPIRQVSFKQPFKALQIAHVNGIDQARLDGIAKSNFDWTDNGIPVGLLEKLDEYDGEIYKIKGAWNVLAEEVEDGANYLQLDLGTTWGRVWVWDRALNNPITLTKKQVAVVEKPVENIPAVSSVTPEDNSTQETEDYASSETHIKQKNEQETRVETQKDDKNVMSHNIEKPVKLTEKQMKQLEKIENQINTSLEAVKTDQELDEYKEMIPAKVRLVIYLIGDLLMTAGATVVAYATAEQIAGLSGAIASALAVFGGGLIASVKRSKK